MPQLSFASLHPKNSRPIRNDTFLSEMKNIVPWQRLQEQIHPFYYQNKKGRKAMDVLLMLRIYCLQQWFNLSDPATEEAIYDRLSFQKFLEIDLMQDRIPDETTILQFRHLLERHQLTGKILKTINDYLSEKGLLMEPLINSSIVSFGAIAPRALFSSSLTYKTLASDLRTSLWGQLHQNLQQSN